MHDVVWEGVGTNDADCEVEGKLAALKVCESVELTVGEGVNEDIGVASCVEVDVGDEDEP